jgi:hypothetical protein
MNVVDAALLLGLNLKRMLQFNFYVNNADVYSARF